MAVGDVVNNIVAVGALGNLTFQPAPGVEVLITGVSSDLWQGAAPNANMSIQLWQRTAAIFSILFTSNAQKLQTNLRMFINNTLYMQIINSIAGVANIGYWGVQVK